MKLTGLARRYAGALFEVAKAGDVVDAIESDLGLITYSLEESPGLRDALAHPRIPITRKEEIVSEVFKGKVRDATLDFLFLLVEKRREGIIGDVETEYVHLANEFRKVVTVMVTSAVPLTDDEKTRLGERVKKLTGKKAEMQLSEDLGIIGGLIIQIGDTVMDGSVRGYLADLREKMLGGK